MSLSETEQSERRGRLASGTGAAMTAEKSTAQAKIAIFIILVRFEMGCRGYAIHSNMSRLCVDETQTRTHDTRHERESLTVITILTRAQGQESTWGPVREPRADDVGCREATS